MREQNESDAYVSLALEKLMHEWKTCEMQSTKVKPIQLARSLKI